MVYKQKGKFELKPSVLQSIVSDILKQPKNQDIVFEIEKSIYKKSKSLYVRFYLGDYTTSLRVSDHLCKGFIRNVLVTENTGVSHIYSKIDRAIRDLRLKRVYSLMKGL